MNNLWLQLWLHVLGDYVTQSHWMATEKVRRMSVAALHAVVYTTPFMVAFHPSIAAVAVMYGTHVVIDRFRLARYVVFTKNKLLSPWVFNPCINWDDCKATGFPSDTPPWLAMWLLIIVDNWMHVTINALALRYL